MGIPSKNENSVAAGRLSPKASATRIVAPEREALVEILDEIVVERDLEDAEARLAQVKPIRAEEARKE